MQKFLSELQRRKVLRIASGYVVAGWIILQVALSLQTALKLPDSFSTIIVALLIIGFPAALVASWFFEITPEGIKRTVPSSGGAMIKPQTTDIILAGMLALVVVIALAQFVMPANREPLGSSTTAQAPKPEAPKTEAHEPEPPVPEASVAVLPFENLSSEKDSAFFAIGIQDEILTRLAKIGSLKVISRTSTSNLSSRPDNLKEIAKQLGVANILEGSIQRQGANVRVNVQLIKASTDGHLWAEIYDRKLENIFAVQSEIAIAIANTLSATVTGAEKKSIAQKPTTNTAAYDAYLRGLTLSRQNDNLAGYMKAAKSFRDAVRLDPDFTLAWAALAWNEALVYFNNEQTDAQRDAARAALETALRLQPDIAEVQLAKGFYHYYVELDYEAARKQFEKVRAKWPSNYESLRALGLVERRLGRWEESKSHVEQAISLDPLRADLHGLLTGVLVSMRDFEAALRMVDSALNLSPGDIRPISMKAGILQSLGRLDEAESVSKPLLQSPPEDQGPIVRQAVLRRQYGVAITVLQAMLDQTPDTLTTADLHLRLGRNHALAGDAKRAAEHFERARTLVLAEMKRQPKNAAPLESLAWTFCFLGDRENALKHIEKAIGIVAKDVSQRLDYEETRMHIWAYFGDRDRAIPEIARLLKLSYFGPLTKSDLRLDPIFDKLRGDSRFEALLKE